MAESSSEAQQPATAAEISLPTELHATETQTSTIEIAGALQNEASDQVSNHDDAEETWLSISEMLENNAMNLRSDDKGMKILLDFNRPERRPNLLLPPTPAQGANRWEPHARFLTEWESYRTERPTPPGQIWWRLDDFTPRKRGIGSKDLYPKYMEIDDAVLLIECLLQGAVEGDDDFGTYKMTSFEHVNMNLFIHSYTEPSNGLSVTAFCDTSRTQAMRFGGRRLPEVDILHLQYHLVYLHLLQWVEVLRRKHVSLSEDRPGFILERHSAKIRRLSSSRTTGATGAGRTGKSNAANEPPEERFEERRLSTSLYLYGKGGEFRLVIVGDAGAVVFFNPNAFQDNHHNTRLRFDPNSLGHLAGLTHFLIVIVHLMDSWYWGWRATLTKIDDIVGFEVTTAHENHPFLVRRKGAFSSVHITYMDHTFDDRKLESHIFDTSDSMDLSKQYFTALQLLRIARQRIENHRFAWEELHEHPDNVWASSRHQNSTSTHDKVLSTLDSFVLSEGGEPIFKIWEDQRERVTQLFKTRTKDVTERIDQKTKEVESLRDGLFNATSLREAMKGMALNRAIYLFTAVTVIFTPLSFLTALWAMPILNATPEGGTVRPSSTAFLATFIIIPILTYLICGYYAWYLTSTKSWKNFSEYSRSLTRNLNFVWVVCAMFASYPFRASTRQTCAKYVQHPPENMPAWALKATKWLVKADTSSLATEA